MPLPTYTTRPLHAARTGCPRIPCNKMPPPATACGDCSTEVGHIQRPDAGACADGAIGTLGGTAPGGTAATGGAAAPGGGVRFAVGVSKGGVPGFLQNTGTTE